jgi:hypothetical protein
LKNDFLFLFDVEIAVTIFDPCLGSFSQFNVLIVDGTLKLICRTIITRRDDDDAVVSIMFMSKQDN